MCLLSPLCKDLAAGAMLPKRHIQTAVDGESKLYASSTLFVLPETIVLLMVHFTRGKCGIL